MTYHLHHEGKDLGTATLDDLRRRRLAGELSGTELVWCDGMPDWRALDEVLGPAAADPPGRPPSLPPLAEPSGPRGSKRAVYWIVGSVALVACLVVAGAFVAIRALREHASRTEGKDPSIAAAQPVATATNRTTVITVRQKNRAFRERQWLEGYRERGERNHPADTDGERMIEKWLEANYGDATSASDTNGPSLTELAEKVGRTIGLNDPALLSVAAQNVSAPALQLELLERAMKAFPQSKHRAYPRLNTAVVLLEALNYPRERRDLFDATLTALRECFADGSIRPEDQPEIAEILVHGWGYNIFYRGRSMFTGVVDEAGPEFQWLARVLHGEHHIIEAWRSRGGGYANTVSEEGWKGFGEHLAAARTNFMAAWKARPDLPLAPARMIAVALGQQGGTEMRQWFDRAIAAQIDYPKAWSDMRWGLRPRWHGDLDSMLAFGRVAVETRRFDTDVPRKFFDVVQDIEAELETPPGEHIYGRPDIWPHFETLYEGYLAEPTQAPWHRGWRTAYGIAAYFAGRYEKAREQFEHLNWSPEEANLLGWGRELSLMTAEVAARTSPLASDIASAEKAFGSRQPGQAMSLYHDLKSRPDADERTRRFIEHRLATLQIEQKYQSGDWTPVLPSTTNDPGWAVLAGAVRVAPDGLVEVTSENRGAMILCRARLGPTFEVEGELELVPPAHESAVGAGLGLGIPTWDAGHWYSFRLTRDPQGKARGVFARNWMTGEPNALASAAVLKPGWNAFQFSIQDHRVGATINGHRVLDGAAVGRPMRIAVDNHQLALIAEQDSGPLTIRYRNLRVRKR